MEFKEFCTFKEGYVNPSQKIENYFDGPHKWVRAVDVNNNKIYETTRTLSEEGFRSAGKSAYKFPKNSLVITKSGTIGRVGLLQDEMAGNRATINIVVDNNKILTEYLFYYLIHHRPFIESLAVGSVQKNLYVSVLEKLTIEPPDLTYQSRVVNILRNIEDKIEINEQLIANLEELSQTLFKRWFIDFEFPDENGNPYKLSGGDIVETHLGLIPPQWEICTLNQVGSITGGATPSKKIPEYYTTPGISWITPKDLSNNKNKYIYSGETDISELGLQKSSAKLMPRNTVLFSSRAPIGYIALAGKEVTTNQGFKSIVPDKGYSPFYIYFLLKEKLPTIEQAAGGSTFKEISGKGLKQIEIYLPPKKIVDEYHSLVKIYFEKINNIELENKSLTKLRDTLLPKLISGELELPEALEV